MRLKNKFWIENNDLLEGLPDFMRQQIDSEDGGVVVSRALNNPNVGNITEQDPARKAEEKEGRGYDSVLKRYIPIVKDGKIYDDVLERLVPISGNSIIEALLKEHFGKGEDEEGGGILVEV